MVKKLITEISEEDFRKLDLTVYKYEWVKHPNGNKSLHYVPYKINDLLDKEIEYMLDSGYENDKKDLSMPVTIAIHEENYGDDYSKNGLHGYFDKFMNQYSGITTYYIAWGIRHLYSTRDYYEDHDDYWKVRKDETKVIYRVTLDQKWLDKFVLKHKTECVKWPYGSVQEVVSKEDVDKAVLEIYYDLEDGEWVEHSRCCVIKNGRSTQIIPVDKDGNRRHPVLEEDL